jgi:hypothetical protein
MGALLYAGGVVMRLNGSSIRTCLAPRRPGASCPSMQLVDLMSIGLN